MLGDPGVLQRLRAGQPQRCVRQPATRLVLFDQYVYEIHQSIGPSESRKDKILLQLLVIVFDEGADNLG